MIAKPIKTISLHLLNNPRSYCFIASNAMLIISPCLSLSLSHSIAQFSINFLHSHWLAHFIHFFSLFTTRGGLWAFLIASCLKKTLKDEHTRKIARKAINIICRRIYPFYYCYYCYCWQGIILLWTFFSHS